jgi:hypothetical protein
MRSSPHFRARIQILDAAAGGPTQGFFGFPESGERNVPLGMARVAGYNTVKLAFQPGAQIPNGSSFEASCWLITEEPYLQVIEPGVPIEIWDGRVIARGTVLEVLAENWKHPLGLPKCP